VKRKKSECTKFTESQYQTIYPGYEYKSIDTVTQITKAISNTVRQCYCICSHDFEGICYILFYCSDISCMLQQICTIFNEFGF
jgi:hypothetical protein